LNIDFKELVNEKYIEVYDELGKLLLTQTTTEPFLQLNVSGFNSGIYFLKVMLDNKQVIKQKFIIER